MRPSVVGIALAALSCGACTYDFDEPFSRTSGGEGGAAGGSTSSSAGISSSGAAGATASAGTGGGPVGEQCGNGTDDDADALVDCADPDCSDFTCVTEAPAGWSGPDAFFVGQGMTACGSGGTAIAGGMDPIPSKATCSGCVCDGPTGGACSLANLSIFDSTGCIAQEGLLSPAQANSCDSFTVSDPNCGSKGQPPVLTSAPTCNASGGMLDAPPSTFSANTVVCADAPLGAGCNPGAVCAAKPAAPFFTAPCIHQAGDVACPPGPYANKTLAYTGIDEGRSCSACGCGGAVGASCTGSTSIWDDPSCTGAPLVVVPHDGACHSFLGSNIDLSYEFMPGTPTGGSCPPTGGQLQGSVSGTSPVTICCPN